MLQRVREAAFIPGAPWVLKNEDRWGWMALMVAMLINALFVKESRYDHVEDRRCAPQ